MEVTLYQYILTQKTYSNFINQIIQDSSTIEQIISLYKKYLLLRRTFIQDMSKTVEKNKDPKSTLLIHFTKYLILFMIVVSFVNFSSSVIPILCMSYFGYFCLDLFFN